MKMKKKYMGGGMNKPRMTYRMGGLSKAQSREMDQDNDGDIDGQDLAMLRKAKHGMKMEYGHGGKNKMYSMEHGGETMKRTGFMEMGSKMPKFKMGEDDTMDALIIMQDGGVPLKKKTIPQEGAEMPGEARDTPEAGVGKTPPKEAEKELQMYMENMDDFARQYPDEFKKIIMDIMGPQDEMEKKPDTSMYDPKNM
jgi:hypothetical protein